MDIWYTVYLKDVNHNNKLPVRYVYCHGDIIHTVIMTGMVGDPEFSDRLTDKLVDGDLRFTLNKKHKATNNHHVLRQYISSIATMSPYDAFHPGKTMMPRGCTRHHDTGWRLQKLWGIGLGIFPQGAD